MSIRTIEFAIGSDSITPSSVSPGGRQDEHNPTKVKFNINNVFLQALRSEATQRSGNLYYRFDIYDGEGSIHRLESALVSANDTYEEVSLDNSITRYGGTVTIYIVFTVVESATEKTVFEYYSKPAKILLENLPDSSTEGDDTERESLTTLAESAKNARDLAFGYATSIQNMGVQASGLSAGANPTVQKIVNPTTGAVTLAFGIPKGDKGDTGATGPQGPQGPQGIQGPKGDDGEIPTVEDKIAEWFENHPDADGKYLEDILFTVSSTQKDYIHVINDLEDISELEIPYSEDRMALYLYSFPGEYSSRYYYFALYDTGRLLKIHYHGDTGTDIITYDTAILSSLFNKEDISNKIYSISSSSTDIQYPSAYAVYAYVETVRSIWTIFISHSQFIDATHIQLTDEQYNILSAKHSATKVYIEITEGDPICTVLSYYHTNNNDMFFNAVTSQSAVELTRLTITKICVGLSTKIAALYSTTYSIVDSVLSSSDNDDIPTAGAVYNYHDNTKENSSNKVTSLSSLSTDTQYPTAKCVYDLVGNIESALEALL